MLLSGNDNHIAGMGIQGYVTGTFEGLKRLDDRHHFHPVIGCVSLTARQLSAVATVHHDAAPTTGAGISAAGAIGIDDYGSVWHSG